MMVKANQETVGLPEWKALSVPLLLVWVYAWTKLASQVCSPTIVVLYIASVAEGKKPSVL